MSNHSLKLRYALELVHISDGLLLISSVLINLAEACRKTAKKCTRVAQEIALKVGLEVENRNNN